MALKLDRTALGILRQTTTRSNAIQFEFVVNQDSVMFDRRDGILKFFTFRIILGRFEIDVISLPGQRRKAHIHQRLGLGVKTATLIIFAPQPE